MIRPGLVVPLFVLMASSAHATPPTVPPPLEVRLAKMQVVVVGLLGVDGEGKDRKVSLKVSHVLKRPADLERLKPGVELTVTPRPVGFSDQLGNGVWSLDIDHKGDPLHATRYEFITYGRNHEEIKKKIESLKGEPGKEATERAEVLKQNLDSFELQLLYHGPQDKPYHALTLSMHPNPERETSRFSQRIQINESQAGKIVNHLIEDGFLDQAVEAKSGGGLQPVRGYTLVVSVQGMTLRAALGWNLAMLERLDGLKQSLDGEAKQAMEVLLNRLSGHRRLWEADEEKKS